MNISAKELYTATVIHTLLSRGWSPSVAVTDTVKIVDDLLNHSQKSQNDKKETNEFPKSGRSYETIRYDAYGNAIIFDPRAWRDRSG